MKELTRYVKAKKYDERIEAKGLQDKIRRLKRRNIMSTMKTLQKIVESGDDDDDVVDSVYYGLLELWG